MPEPLSSQADRAREDSIGDLHLDHFPGSIISSPVPNFASTLTTQAEQDVEDENLRFLRGELSSLDNSTLDEQSLSLSASHPLDAQRPWHANNDYHSLPGYAALLDRAQEVMQQDYNRWAPGSSEADDEGSSTLSRQQSAYEAAYSHDDHEGTDIVRDRMRARRLRDRSHWEHMPRQPADGEAPQRYPSRFVENGMSASSNEPSLRTQAMLQAVRQNSQMSPRSRGHLQRFILDRERLGFEYDSRDRERSDSDTNSNHLSLSQRRHVQAQRNEQQSLRQARSLLADAQRRTNHLAEQMRSSGNFRPNQREASSALQQRPRPLPYTRTSSSEGVDLRRTPAVSAAHSPDNNASVENTLKYLESLRLCESQSEGLEAAIDTGFNLEELFPNHDAEFLIDIRCIPPPPDSSWLQVGSVLSGSQHAMPARALTFSVPPRPHSDRSRIRHPTLGITSARTPSPVRASTNTAPYLRLPATQAADFDDQWPVKVTIHGVDYKEMTLSGTMEACEVPDKTVPSKTSNITTYLEGEIIDFNKFTLETKNFQADTRTDGVYWRKLPPFKDLKDEETIVRCLLNKDWLKSYLMQNWILMRWKEKHFVTPSEAESSLTISGFYYVSLRRSDGHVEGLYYDPHSTPYQHLSLNPTKRHFPAYAFR